MVLLQVKEQQAELEDKVQAANQLQEQLVLSERRGALMAAEEAELRAALEQTDRVRKTCENEMLEAAERVGLLSTQVRPQATSDPCRRRRPDFDPRLPAFQNAALLNQKRKLETDLSLLTGEVDEAVQESRSAGEKAKKAVTDVSPDP